VNPEALRSLNDEGLDRVLDDLVTAERAAVAAMAPYNRQLKELRARAAEVATERRRRERTQRQADRRAIRDAAGTPELPTLAEALEAAECPIDPQRPLSDITAFLKTGGEVGFGYPTRPGGFTFTDGRQQRAVSTLASARALFADGWEAGTVAIPGVRIHLAGTKIERVVALDEVVLDARVE